MTTKTSDARRRVQDATDDTRSGAEEIEEILNCEKGRDGYRSSRKKVLGVLVVTEYVDQSQNILERHKGM